jgi:Conserved in the green lineage and diatoms 27
MNSSASVCPVPTEQQPINEYQELKESWFFRWATLELQGYLKPILLLWGLSWLIAAPVAAVSFPLAKYPIQFFLSGAAGAVLFPALALLRLYLGWIYICSRLSQETVFYEESGWYDGQAWQKPLEVLQRDRLIVNYELRPLLQRLKLTFIVILSLLLANGMIWIFL